MLEIVIGSIVGLGGGSLASLFIYRYRAAMG
jgi:hypothetical protein